MKFVIFDMDGTLVDSAALMVESAAAAFAATGLAVPDDEAIRSISGLNLELGLRRIAPDADDAALATLSGHYRNAYLQSVNSGLREPLFDGVLAALDALERRPDTLMAVATGKALRGARRVIALHELDHYFTSVQTPDNNPSKPHPGMIHEAMGQVGAENHETVMIGDTSHDMEMARNAGVKAIGVTWGYHSAETLTESGADVIINDYAELIGTIDRLLESDRHA